MDDDDGAAKVGVTETTRELIAYDHPTNPKIKFWDLPGIGTRNYPNMATYCEKVDLEKFNAFLILTAIRFTEYDLELAEKINVTLIGYFYSRDRKPKFHTCAVTGLCSFKYA